MPADLSATFWYESGQLAAEFPAHALLNCCVTANVPVAILGGY
jgi:hypothetical protein